SLTGGCSPPGCSAPCGSGVPPTAGGAVLAGLSVTAAATAGGALLGADDAVRAALAVLVAAGVAELLLRHCTRRFGGVTGDVFGGLAETAATTALLVLCLG
ncbi:adenosylcobinamide-GDP ribazoletransferase, partial [Streptomyces sp. NPDC005574]|uniref:adenosylcobinamide-GDP ribazoletransferase n=1 Tax=Streptomyces sp. NPDC005574 TaxID=3156891 RepID=UPI0033A8E91A